MSGSPSIFDRSLYATRLARARAGGPDILNRTIAEELVDRLALINRHFARACVIAPNPHPIAEALAGTGRATITHAMTPPEGDDLGLGEERFDAIFNILDLHAVNDVPGALAQMKRALVPDGLMLAALFAGDTLSELRQSFLAAEAALTGGASLRVAPMIGIRELGALLQRAGLALPVADLDRTIVRYGDVIALIHDIRSLGFSNMMRERSTAFMSRRLLGAAADHYHRNFADADGRIRATLEVAWLTAWSPHDSQQKPLKPGSAKMRLAEALKVKEEKLQ